MQGGRKKAWWEQASGGLTKESVITASLANDQDVSETVITGSGRAAYRRQTKRS